MLNGPKAFFGRKKGAMHDFSSCQNRHFFNIFEYVRCTIISFREKRFTPKTFFTKMKFLCDVTLTHVNLPMYSGNFTGVNAL